MPCQSLYDQPAGRMRIMLLKRSLALALSLASSISVPGPKRHASRIRQKRNSLAPVDHLVALEPGIFCPSHRTVPVPKVLTWAISLEDSILPLYTSATEEQP